MRLNKNTKIFLNYFLGPALFIWLSWSVYRQIKQQPNLSDSWANIKASLYSSKIFYLLGVFLLMFINWWFEALKWKWAVATLQKISLGKAYKAILSGVSFSVSTPNRIGEYLGRILYMDENSRLKAIALTIVCSISQLIITLLCGLIGILILKDKIIGSSFGNSFHSDLWIEVLMYGVGVAATILTVFYFRVSVFSSLLDKFRNGRYSFLSGGLRQVNATLLLKLLSLSAARFFVFILQYFFVFRLFNVQVDWVNSFAAVSVIFLVLAIIPSFAIAELGLRGEVSLQLLSVFSANSLGIGLATATIWFINLVIPAVAGSLLILSIKIFKNRNERN